MTDAVPLTTEWKPVKLRVEDYLMLDDAGAFDSYGRTELIEGEVVYMNALHRPHARIQTRFLILLAAELAKRSDGLEPLIEGSVSMPPYNVPAPDISVTSEPEGSGLIPLSSLALVIEVSDTTLRNDLGRKAKIYAREGVPEYWVIDVNASVIYQMWRPVSASYSEQRIVAFGDLLTAAAISNLTVDTKTL
ncbi:Uma2 family endonuclease [Sphingomonas sp. LT1P40]|uniref:Uma2 family endonuclease n=1 Tax=Alteristakelama amylovorans TaxID=3096166 RepID=UPI002FC93FE3